MHHDWHNPIDGFLDSGSLIRFGRPGSPLQVECVVLSATGPEGQDLRSLMACTRRLSRRPACEWTLAEHQKFETLEQQLSTLVQNRRRRLLSAWKERMRDGASLARHKADGTPAVSAKEQGQVIADEWRPRWTEIPETRFQRNQRELQAICDAFGHRVPPFPRPSRWSVRDIRRECRNTAAGIDGLSFKQFAGLPDLFAFDSALRALRCYGLWREVACFLAGSFDLPPQSRVRSPLGSGTPWKASRCIQLAWRFRRLPGWHKEGWHLGWILGML